MFTSRRWIVVAILALGARAAMAQEIEFLSRTPTFVEGRTTGVRFLGREDLPQLVRVEIELESATILADVDYLTGVATVASTAGENGEVVSLTPGDVLGLRALAIDELPDAGLAERTLRRLVNLLSTLPPGEAIDVTFHADTKAISSLCSKTGKQVKGTYVVNNQTFSEKVVLGPCYAASNSCLGRCGLGCGPLGMSTEQQFTQDCLNHDLCTRKTGEILGECATEWTAASDDFLFGQDCADFDGRWTDNGSYKWTLKQGGSQITGSVKGAGNEAHCLTWTVLGSHAGENVTLRGSRLFQRSGCCTSFALTGKATSCNRANGTWTNACGLSGTWSMSRQGVSGASRTPNANAPSGPGASPE